MLLTILTFWTGLMYIIETSWLGILLKNINIVHRLDVNLIETSIKNKKDKTNPSSFQVKTSKIVLSPNHLKFIRTQTYFKNNIVLILCDWNAIKIYVYNDTRWIHHCPHSTHLIPRKTSLETPWNHLGTPLADQNTLN